MCSISYLSIFFFFNDTATTEIYTLSLHDALPISDHRAARRAAGAGRDVLGQGETHEVPGDEEVAGKDRKSTRLNSSHSQISYAVFCLKKKKKISTYVISDTCTHILPNTARREQ